MALVTARSGDYDELISADARRALITYCWDTIISYYHFQALSAPGLWAISTTFHMVICQEPITSTPIVTTTALLSLCSYGIIMQYVSA